VLLFSDGLGLRKPNLAARKLVLLALAAGLPVPASAAVTVIGSSAARLCYEAAESPLSPRIEDLSRCDVALTAEHLGRNDTVATHVNRGILRLRRGNIGLAVADFDDAISLDPSQPEAYLNKGAAMIREDDAEQALGLFTMALERNTSRPDIAHYGRAIANEALGHVAQAYADFRRASELSPDWAQPRAELQRFRIVPR